MKKKDDVCYAVRIHAIPDTLKVKRKDSLFIIYNEENDNRIACGSGNAGSEVRDMRFLDHYDSIESVRLEIKNPIRPDETDEQEIVRAIEVFAGTTNTLCDSEEIYVGVAFEWKYNKDKVEYWVVHTDGSVDGIEKKDFDAYEKQLKEEEED